MDRSPRTWHCLLLDPEHYFLLGSAPLSALHMRLDLSEYQNLPKPSPKSHFLLNIVCWVWSAVEGGGTPKIQVITQIIMSTHPQKIYRLICLKYYGSRDQEALFCFYFFEGEGSVKITICNSPRITLLVRRSLWVFKIKVIWKVLIAFLSILPLHPSLRLS